MGQKNTFLTKLFGVLNKAGTAIMINLLFLVSCLPVVTMGAAWSGLYGAVRYQIRGDGWFDGFKVGYRCHLVRNIVSWTLGVGVCLYALWSLLPGIDYFMDYPKQLLSMDIVPFLIHCLVFVVSLLFTTAMIPISLYFESDANDWLSNTWDLIKHAPLQVLVAAALMWAPFVTIAVSFFWGYNLLLVFIAAYFILAAVVMTVVLKNPLIRILNRIRAENGEDEEGDSEEEED